MKKTHKKSAGLLQQRNITLDPQTIELVKEFAARPDRPPRVRGNFSAAAEDLILTGLNTIEQARENERNTRP